MATTPSSKSLFVAKIAAIVFAVSAAGYIVVSGHQDANPPAGEPAPADTAPSGGVPAAAGDAATTDPAKKDDPTFFYSSKSMPISPPTIIDEEPGDAAAKKKKEKKKAIERALFPSSKSLVMPTPTSGTKKAKPEPKAAK